MQLTVTPKAPTGLTPLNGATGITRPVTVTWTWPSRSTVPLPEVMAHGRPPPLIPRSLKVPTAAPVTGVIDSNEMRVPPSSAAALEAPNATRLAAPRVATSNLRNPVIDNLPLNPEMRLLGGDTGPGYLASARPKTELSRT